MIGTSCYNLVLIDAVRHGIKLSPCSVSC